MRVAPNLNVSSDHQAGKPSTRRVPNEFLKPLPADPRKPCTSFKTVWSEIGAEAGVGGCWHDNRHTLITELAEDGCRDQTIQDIAGHVSRQMLQHRSHIRKDAKRKALDSIVSAEI